MVKRIQLAYEDSRHKHLSEQKERLRVDLDKKRFSWESFFWHLASELMLK